ncbi:hypothetical protein D9M73_279600 [compost metagenome]
MQITRSILPRCSAEMTTFDQRKTTLHRILQPQQQQYHGDDREHRTQTDRTDEQQTRQHLITRHPTEQPEQKVHYVHLPVANTTQT